MAEPKKLIELQGKDWLAGLSIQAKLGVGGLFKEASNFDPFKRLGVFVPSATATDVSGSVVTAESEFFVGSIESNASWFYAFADNTKVYKVQTQSNAVTDVSSDFKQFSLIKGATRHKSKLIYASATTVYAAFMPPVLATTVSLFTPGVIVDSDHIMKTGPDRNLYITNKNSVARVTNVAGTSGNSPTYLTFEDDVVIRDLDTDGRYLIILGDTNTTSLQNTFATFRCFVAFWNMKSQDLTQIWEFNDRYTIGLKFIEDEVLVVTGNGYYTCNVDSPIRPIQSVLGESTFENLPPPATTRGIVKVSNDRVLIASSGSANGNKVIGYGRSHPGLKKVFYQPYKIGTHVIAGIYYDGFNIWAGDAAAGGGAPRKLFKVPVSNSDNVSVIKLSDIDFKNPYTFSFAKVVLERPMSGSTQSVKMGIRTANGDRMVLANSTFDYSTYGTTITHIFQPNPLETIVDAPAFEDMTDITITNSQAAIRRVEIWGIPQRPDQDVY